MNVIDAIRRAAKDLHDQVEIDDCDVPVMRIELATLLSDIALYSSDAETPEPASPSVRECLETVATLLENHGNGMYSVYERVYERVDIGGRLATEARAALAAPVAETPSVADEATPCVRAACTALIAFTETIAAQKRQDGKPSSRSAAARELAKGARSALARPIVKIPEIVAELVAMCETAKGVLALAGSTGQIGQLTALQVAGALAEVIAKAKGKSA